MKRIYYIMLIIFITFLIGLVVSNYISIFSAMLIGFGGTFISLIPIAIFENSRESTFPKN